MVTVIRGRADGWIDGTKEGYDREGKKSPWKRKGSSIVATISFYISCLKCDYYLEVEEGA